MFVVLSYVVIGGGLALNGIRFESVGDFIPEPRCSKFVVGLQTRRRKMGCIRGPVGFDRKGQE